MKKVVVKHKHQDTMIREGRKIGDGLWQVSFGGNEIVEVEDEVGGCCEFDVGGAIQADLAGEKIQTN